MTQFRVKAGVLQTMFAYARAEGKNTDGKTVPLLNDCVLNVMKNTLFIQSVDENQTLITLAKYPINKEDVKSVGEIPIFFEKSIKAVNRFKANDIIVVEHLEGNLIEYRRKTPKLEVTATTIDRDAVASAIEDTLPFKYDSKQNAWTAGKGFKTEAFMKIDAAEFEEVVKDGEQIEHRSFPFTIEGKTVSVTVADDESGDKVLRELKPIEKTLKVDEDIGSVYSYGFGNAFNNLKGELSIWVKDGGPMFIKQVHDDISLTYVLATTELQDEKVEEDENTDNIETGEMDEKLQESLDDSEDEDSEE